MTTLDLTYYTAVPPVILPFVFVHFRLPPQALLFMALVFIEFHPHGSNTHYILAVWLWILIFSSEVHTTLPCLSPKNFFVGMLYSFMQATNKKIDWEQGISLGALPQIFSLFDRERIENYSLSDIISASYTFTHSDCNSLLCWYRMSKSLIMSEYFTLSASLPPSNKIIHQRRKLDKFDVIFFW